MLEVQELLDHDMTAISPNSEGKEIVTRLQQQISALEQEIKDLKTKRKQDYLDYLELAVLLEQTQAKLIQLESQ